MNRQGLKKIRKSVKGGGMRSYWIRAQSAVSHPGRTLRNAAIQHGGKVAATVAMVALAGLAHRNKSMLSGMASSASGKANHWRRYHGAGLAEKIIQAGGSKLAEHYGEKLGAKAGRRMGKRFGKHGQEFGEVLGGTIGGTVAGHVADKRFSRAAKSVGTRLRKKDLFPTTPKPKLKKARAK